MPAIHVPTNPYTDLKKSGAKARDIVTYGEAEGWVEMLSNKKLKTLVVHGLTDATAAVAGRLQNLEVLDIKGCSAKNLSALGGLKRLRHLKISTAPGVRDFLFLGQLQKLKILELTDVTKFKDVRVLEKLPSLHTLEISKMFSWVKFPTLTSFAKLKQLRVLHLGFDSEDGSLSPIAKLSNLRELSLPLAYELTEYARLAAALPQTKCSLFTQPYRAFRSDFLKCKRCDGSERIGLARPWRMLCAKCDEARFQAYLKTFEETKYEFRRKSTKKKSNNT